jgi:hypothetical protein
MTRLRRLGVVCLLAGVSAAAVLPAGNAQSAILRTKISLEEFKAAYNLASVRKLIDNNKTDGVRFHIASRPRSDNGNKKQRFILFRTDSEVVSAIFELLKAMTVRGRLLPGGGPPTELTCDLGGTNSSGVTSVQCGEGLTVSPS